MNGMFFIFLNQTSYTFCIAVTIWTTSGVRVLHLSVSIFRVRTNATRALHWLSRLLPQPRIVYCT